MSYFAIALGITILLFFTFDRYRDSQIKNLNDKLEHLTLTIERETGVLQAEEEYQSLYDQRIAEMKEELAMRNAKVADKREDAPIGMQGIYNIPENDNEVVVTNRVTREVTE